MMQSVLKGRKNIYPKLNSIKKRKSEITLWKNLLLQKCDKYSNTFFLFGSTLGHTYNIQILRMSNKYLKSLDFLDE